jgi:4-alpha-glucanotransferase
VTHDELIKRAQAHGMSATYLNWRDESVQVNPQVLAAILDALGEPPAAGAGVGARGLGNGGGSSGAPPAGRPRLPQTRQWGFTVQLYSVRSRRSWGHGDLRDLADLARWAGRQLGAGFILINPLHATEPLAPVTDSPYRAMSRRYISPLYLRIEDVEEFTGLGAVQRQLIEELAAPLRAASCTPDLIDRDSVWTAKRQALELVYTVRRSDEREAAFRAFVRREGDELIAWATWCALAEVHGPDWRRWPAELADPDRAMRLAATGRLAEQAAFHAWLQWLVDEQLATAQRAALSAGMDIGLIGDLAVGVHPGGADAWAHQDLLVGGMSVGAPPDGFNQHGQSWEQPPWHPHLLAATGGRPLADLLRTAYRHVGGLRVDHVMGLMRLWWVPDGMPPGHGAYVNYDYQAMVGALTGEAVRAGAIAIGEDLGTVDPWIRDYLADQHVLGTELLWFAREPDGAPLLNPRRWRRACLATVGTHDVPPISGFVTGDQVSVRAGLGLLKDPEGERRSAALALSRWRAALVAERLLPVDPAVRATLAGEGGADAGITVGAGAGPWGGGEAGRQADPTPEEFTVALYGFLALTPALLIGVSLADAVGDRRTQNIPGTSREYPNWRVPLCNGEGEAVLLEDLDKVPLIHAVVNALLTPLASGRPLGGAVLAGLCVALAAAQGPGRVIPALRDQPGQRRRRVGPPQVLRSRVERAARDDHARVGVLGEVLSHVRTPVTPDIRDDVEVAGGERS